MARNKNNVAPNKVAGGPFPRKRRGAGRAAAVFLAAVAAALLPAASVFAIADPDAIIVNTAWAYDGVLETGDLLLVVDYNVDYASLPTEIIAEAFFARFLVGGSQVNSVETVPFNDRGWGSGIFSFYWSAAEKAADSIEFENTNSESYQIVVQGKPSIFADPPKIVATGIDWRDNTNTEASLRADVETLAEALENDSAWVANNVDLLTRLAGEVALATSGEDYFGRAIPNLSGMIPDMFSTSRQPVQFLERDHGSSTQDGLDGFWAGSPVDTFFDSAAADLRIGKSVLTSLTAFVAMAVIAFIVGAKTSNQQWGLITMPFTLGIFMAWTWIPMAVGGLAVFVAVLLLAYSYILRGRTL